MAAFSTASVELGNCPQSAPVHDASSGTLVADYHDGSVRDGDLSADLVGSTVFAAHLFD